MAFSLPIPPDTAIITDDASTTGAALVDALTGTFLGFVPLADFAAGSESGAVMLDGTIATPDNRSGSGNGIVGIYDGELSLIVNAVVGSGATYPTGVTTDRVLYFYIIAADGSDALTLYQVNKAGTVLDSWDLATTYAGDPVGCAVARDNSVLYFVSDFTGTIKKVDLVTDVVTTEAALGTAIPWLGVGADGNIYVNRNVAGNPTIEKYDTAFTLLDSVAGGPDVTYGLDTSHWSADDLHVFAWTQKNSGGANPDKLSAIRKIRLSDFAVINDVTDIPTESNSGNITEGSEISNSCPLLITGTPPTTPVSYKSIVWPVWLKDGTFIVFTGSYLGHGRSLRFDLDGNLVQAYDYSQGDFTAGMYNQAALIDENSCLPEVNGMLWLAGHYNTPPGSLNPWNPGIQAIDIDTGAQFPIVQVAPTQTEVDISAGLTVLGAKAYSASDGEPTDQGLPPKPDVSCGPIANLRTPQPNPCCNAGGIHPVASYTGASGTVPSAPDPTGEETLTGKTAVFVDVEIQHTEYPAETPETLRYALVELDDEFRKEGRIESIGDVEHGLSDPQGNMESASINITIMDADGEPIGSRMLDEGLKYFTRDEVLVRARSDWGRRFGDAQSPPVVARQIGRGLLYGESYGTTKVAQLTANDPFFVDGGSFSPDKKVPQFNYPLKYYVNAPPDLANYFVPIIIGEPTDHLAKNPSTGLVLERGMCPGRFVGMDTTLGQLWGRINNNLYAIYAITDLYGSDCGGLGCYGRIARSDGLSPSTIGLDGTSDFTMIPAGGWAQLVLYTANGRSEHRITKVNIAAHSVRVEGQIDPTVLVGEIPWFIERIDHVPMRVKIDIAARQGDDVMVPGYAGYTRPTTYEDFYVDGQKWRVTDYWVRGVLLAEHLSGGCTLATNTIGIESVGDGSGLPIVDYFTGYNWFLDNCVHQQSTAPPIGGNTWATSAAELPAWSDGWTKTKSSDFERMQAQTVVSLGGYGLRLGAYFDEGISLRDAMQLWNDNALCRTYVDEWGRIGVWILDEEDDPSTWPKVEHVSRVFGQVRRWRALDEAMNVVRGGTEWDPDQRVFRFEDVEVRSTGAIQRNKGILRRSKHYDGKIVFDYKHFEYLLGRQLWMQQDGPIYVSIEQGDIGWLDYPVGSGIQFNSIMLPGGDANVYWLVILKKTFHVDTHTVSVLCLEAGSEMTAGQEGTLLVPSANQFLVTDTDAVAPLVTDVNADAPVVAQ